MPTLFRGRQTSERVVVELRRSADGGILLASQSIGPMAERYFGEEEVETFLTIRPGEVERVAALLRSGSSTAPDGAAPDALQLLARRYTGDSAATTHLREWLDANGIGYDFWVR